MAQQAVEFSGAIMAPRQDCQPALPVCFPLQPISCGCTPKFKRERQPSWSGGSRTRPAWQVNHKQSSCPTTGLLRSARADTCRLLIGLPDCSSVPLHMMSHCPRSQSRRRFCVPATGRICHQGHQLPQSAARAAGVPLGCTKLLLSCNEVGCLELVECLC